MSGFVRTLVPVIVGWLLSLPLAPAVIEALGVSAEDVERAVTAAVTSLTAAGYWALVRWAEKRWPSLSWLLGSGRQPVYVPSAEAEARPVAR